MKASTTLKLLVAVAVLAAVVWRIEERRRPDVPVRKAPFEGLSMDDVNFLFCRKGDVKVECSRKDRGWFMSYPVRARADSAVVAKVLSMAEGLSALEMITPEQRESRDLTLADYGLDKPGMSIKLGGGYFLRELLVGDSAPIGDSVYVMLAGEEAVYAVSGNVTNIIPPSTTMFRDPHILPGDPTKATRIEIQQPGGFVQLVRKSGTWWIQQPFLAQADGGKIDSFLRVLFSMKASEFVWDPPADESDDARVQAGSLMDVYGFAEDVSPARMTVWINGDEIGREVIFGADVPDEAGLVYARRKSFDSIFAVRKDQAPLREISAVDLRDRLIFALEPGRAIEMGVSRGDTRLILHRTPEQGWMITQPVKWQADDDYVKQLISLLARLEVAEYVESEAGKTLKDIRLDPPEFSIGLSTEPCKQNSGGADDSVNKTLRECCSDMVVFGSQDTNGTRYVRFPSGQLALVSKDTLGHVDAERLANPLQYRDRTVLSLPAKSIRRIDLESGVVKESIALSSNGVWSCVSDPDRRIAKPVLQDLLLLAANLRAVDFESLNPKNLSAYGLEPPAVSLTFGLSGEEGIQKTVMLGFKSGTEGIYGLIQGQDLLLTFYKKTADILSRRLLLPQEPDQSSSSLMESGSGGPEGK